MNNPPPCKQTDERPRQPRRRDNRLDIPSGTWSSSRLAHPDAPLGRPGLRRRRNAGRQAAHRPGSQRRRRPGHRPHRCPEGLGRERIPIDCIAGTSMGAVVGGLYAAGLSPAELEDLVLGIPWNEAFKDKPSRTSSPSAAGRQPGFKIDLNLGYGDGRLKTAKGFVQGQNLNILLKKLLLHKADVQDFDHCPSPFGPSPRTSRRATRWSWVRGIYPPPSGPACPSPAF